MSDAELEAIVRDLADNYPTDADTGGCALCWRIDDHLPTCPYARAVKWCEEGNDVTCLQGALEEVEVERDRLREALEPLVDETWPDGAPFVETFMERADWQRARAVLDDQAPHTTTEDER